MVGLLLIPALLELISILWLVLPKRSTSLKSDSPNKQTGHSDAGPMVSVIIAARNESANLANNLPSILSQITDVPFEVIVILDRCSDRSKAVLEDFQQQYANLRNLEIKETPSGWSPKKHALTQGILAAGSDWLVFTDADCAAESEWLQGMVDAFESGNELIIGASPFNKEKGLLNLMARFENWMTGLKSTGAARRGLPYMAVGRSLGYKKQLWEKAGGFSSHASRLSGDDDLFVNTVSGFAKVGVLSGPGKWVFTDAPHTWSGWIRQKLRHHSAAPAYALRSKLILAKLHGLHLIFYLSLGLAFIFGANPVWVALTWVCRSLCAGVLWSAAPWPNRNLLAWLFPLLDIAYLLYLLSIGTAGMILKPQWKGK